MIKSVADITKAAWSFVKNSELARTQGVKFYQNVDTLRPYFYSSNPLLKGWDLVQGAGQSIGRTARNFVSPFHMRSSEFARQTGWAKNQVDVLRHGRTKIKNILDDPKNWRDGKVRTEGTRNERLKFLTKDASNAVTHIEKDMHSIPYYVEANLNRVGVVPHDKSTQKIFKQNFGETIDLKSAEKLLGSNAPAKIENILSTWSIDKQTKVIKMNNIALNTLQNDVQMSPQFQKLAKILFSGNKVNKFYRGKIKTGREMVRYLNKRGLNVKLVGDKKTGEAVMTFSPPRRTNFYTGGINGKVYINPKDPGHVYVMPSDVYDLYGNKMDFLTKKILGMKNNQLNLMGIKRVKVPDPSNWGKPKDIVAKVSKDRIKGIKKAKKASNVPENIDYGQPSYTDEQVKSFMKSPNKRLEAMDEIVRLADETNITASRAIKTFGVGGSGILTASWFMGDDDE